MRLSLVWCLWAACVAANMEYAFEVREEEERRRGEIQLAQLIERDNTETTASATATESSSTDSETSSTSTASDSDSSGSSADSNSSTATPTDSSDSSDSSTGSSSGSSSGSTETSKSTTSLISVDPRQPVGAPVLVQPTSTSTTYIKSGDTVTFKWSYTNLINTPSAINVEAHCSSNSQVYTIASHQSPKTSSAVWDTSNDTDASHLITAEYTLVIYDANNTPSAIASAGSLGTFNYMFGVYIPQKYVPWPKNDNYISIALQNRPTILTLAVAIVTIVIATLM